MGDNGKGLNLPLLARKANIDPSKDLDLEIAESIFSSGIATAETISKKSGKDVGIDAVRHYVEKIMVI